MFFGGKEILLRSGVRRRDILLEEENLLRKKMLLFDCKFDALRREACGED